MQPARARHLRARAAECIARAAFLQAQADLIDAPPALALTDQERPGELQQTPAASPFVDIVPPKRRVEDDEAPSSQTCKRSSIAIVDQQAKHEPDGLLQQPSLDNFVGIAPQFGKVSAASSNPDQNDAPGAAEQLGQSFAACSSHDSQGAPPEQKDSAIDVSANVSLDKSGAASQADSDCKSAKSGDASSSSSSSSDSSSSQESLNSEKLKRLHQANHHRRRGAGASCTIAGCTSAGGLTC